MNRLLIYATILFSFSSVTFAASDCTSAAVAGPNCFQIGDSWNKIELQKLEDLSTVPLQLHPAIKGSAQFLVGASGVLLGKFNNQWVMASSFHMCQQTFGGVCPKMVLNGNLRFLGVPFRSEEIIGAWPEVDLLLFTVSFREADEASIQGVGQSFDFHSKIISGTELAVAGYTAISGFSGNLQISMDSDCKILSPDEQTKLMADPDTVKPDTEKKWAFAMGCDVARGDSGGAVINKASGKILGLVWTEKTPTEDFVKDSAQLESMRLSQDSKVWSNVSYASPASKIREVLEITSKDQKTSENHKEIIGELLQ